MIPILKRHIKKLSTRKQDSLVKVYSHPRSGTHFIEAFIAKNFYQDRDLSIPQVKWGHWSNRQINSEGNLYGQLFGNHYFAERNKTGSPKVYIVRDGRAVAYSIWKTPNFLHKDISNLTFKQFLRTPIDWSGTPAIKSEPCLTILEHWVLHVKGWYQLAENNSNILIIKYEDLVNEPYEQYLKIHTAYFNKTKKLLPSTLNVIETPIGLLPNKAKVDAWKHIIDANDILYYNDLVKKNRIEI